MPSLENNQTVIIDTSPNKNISKAIDVSISPSVEKKTIIKSTNIGVQKEINDIKQNIARNIITSAIPYSSETSFDHNSELLRKEFEEVKVKMSPQLVKAFLNMESYNCYER